MSDGEEILAFHIRASKLPEPVRQYRFAPKRRWKFDFAWPDLRVAVEVDGGGWVYGRHNRPEGFAADCEKLNTATLMGWRVLRFTPTMVEDGIAVDTIKLMLQQP